MTAIAATAELAWGYTMADVDRSARKAALNTLVGQRMPWDERYEIAWMAIVEAIYDDRRHAHLAEVGPVKVGMRAISDEANAILQSHGFGSKRFDEEEPGPRFSMYWRQLSGKDPDFTERLTEHLALPQVLGQLTALQYEAIAALAAFGDQALAAQHLGIKPKALSARVNAARRTITELWHAPETPRDTSKRRVAAEGECTYGHSLAEHGVVRKDGRLRCRLCARNVQRRRKARESVAKKDVRRAADRARKASQRRPA